MLIMKMSTRFLSLWGFFLLLLTACSSDPEKSTEETFVPLEDSILRDKLLISMDKEAGHTFSRRIFANLDQTSFSVANIQLDEEPDNELALFVKSPHTCDTTGIDCYIILFKIVENDYKPILMVQGNNIKIEETITNGFHDFTLYLHDRIEYWQQMVGEYGFHYDVLEAKLLPKN